MTSRPAALSPAEPNSQGPASLTAPVSSPAPATAAVMMTMFSQSVP